MESLGEVLRRVQPSRTTTADPPAQNDVCPLCDGAGYLRYDVDVGDPQFGRLAVCECTRRELDERRMRRLMSRSNLGALTRLTFESFILKYRDGSPPVRTPDAAWRLARRYADDPRGWLVLWGPFGTGKTHLAAAIANHRLNVGEPAVFIVVPDLLDHLRSTFSPSSEVTYDELFETVRNTPLLILDDLGAHTSTLWAQEKLYQVINDRYNKTLATVITTNMSPDLIEPRLRSRIADGSLSRLVEIRDVDKRLNVVHEGESGKYSASPRPVRKVREDRV
jgi:DNA replication protein DnaC